MVPRITAKELTGLKHQHMNFVIEYVKDFSARRAAEASGYSPDYGHTLKDLHDITAAINRVLESRLEASDIDAEWVLMEAVDNHMIARQNGNISASNTALNLVAKHSMVDALAADKIEVTSDKEIMDRLTRGRKRMNGDPDEEEISFL